MLNLTKFWVETNNDVTNTKTIFGISHLKDQAANRQEKNCVGFENQHVNDDNVWCYHNNRISLAH